MFFCDFFSTPLQMDGRYNGHNSGFFLQKLIEIEEYVQMSNQSYLIGFYLNSFKVNCLSVSNLSPFFRYQINARHAHSLNIKKNAG